MVAIHAGLSQCRSRNRKGSRALLAELSTQPLDIGYKRRADLVTVADRRSEALIVGRLRERFPDHAIVAEEGGNHQSSSDYCWYVDPLDGTTNYAHGFPVYCVTLGLAYRGEVIAGRGLRSHAQ